MFSRDLIYKATNTTWCQKWDSNSRPYTSWVKVKIAKQRYKILDKTGNNNNQNIRETTSRQMFYFFSNCEDRTKNDRQNNGTFLGIWDTADTKSYVPCFDDLRTKTNDRYPIVMSVECKLMKFTPQKLIYHFFAALYGSMTAWTNHCPPIPPKIWLDLSRFQI